MEKFLLVDDSVQGIGGTMLTLDAIFENFEGELSQVSTSDFSLTHAFSKNTFFIFGNITSFTQNSLDAILFTMENFPFVKIEFDYGYCPYRGSIPHKILADQECHCPFGDNSDSNLSKIYTLIKDRSLHIFYMSDAQMIIHDKHLLGIPKTKKSTLSSCFKKETLKSFINLKTKQKNNKFAIIDGKGGWHSKAKGIEKSIKYANDNNLDFDLIKTETYSEMLDKLSNYKSLITFPIIHDTCPRITIEARYMGLDVITDEFSQHITEAWWKGSDEEAFNFTKSRPKYFCEKIKCLH